MNFELSPFQKDLQEQVIGFARKNLGQDMVLRDQGGIFDQAGWSACGTQLLQGLAIPEEFGGKGLDALDTVIALEALGYGSVDGGLNFSIAAHLLACVVPIWLHGSEQQKKEWLPSLCSGSLIVSNAMTEPKSGSDAFQLNTLAKETENGFVLEGEKNFCANAPVADLVLTYAATDPEKGFYGGITAFLLEKKQHSFSTEMISKVGLRTCFSSEKIEIFHQTIHIIGKQ